MRYIKIILQGVGIFLLGFILITRLANAFSNDMVYSDYLYAICFAVLFVGAIIWICTERIVHAIRDKENSKDITEESEPKE